MNLKNNKRYIKYVVSEDPQIFTGYVEGYEVSDITMLQKLAKDLGFSYELYSTLKNIDKDAATAMVKSMSTKSNHPDILLLLDDENKKIINYILDSERAPVLNSEFIHRVSSLAETSSDIEVSEIHYHPEDTIASILIKKEKPIVIEEKYQNEDSKFFDYPVGILIVNDELSASYTRLVVYLDDQPLYLPASYYNTTTSRYRRSTPSSLEALEVLVLKTIDDLREDYFHSKIYELHYRYRGNKHIAATYEEYNTVLRTMRKIPTIIEDNSFLESLLNKYEDFEKKYSQLEEQKSSYIWRCTALSDIPVGALISITSKILSELSAPPIEYLAIRELLGSYMSTNRIAEEIAKEDNIIDM